jgi:two-component sensor histidine kinase
MEDDREFFKGALESLSPVTPTQAFEIRLQTPGGELLWVQWAAIAEFDKRDNVVEYQLVGRDITDRKRMESELKASLKEKEILLKEIHHRVKNNLNIIISLLHLQQRRVADREVFESLKETEFRVRCIGVIHEKLYGSANLADLNINEFLSTLTDHLTQMYESVGSHIKITKDFENIVFPLESVLPLGFITSELLSNSLKHAFPNNSNGEIHLSLRSVGDGKYEFMLKDTGVGFGNDVDLNNLKSLGLDLVRSFTKQLDGDLDIKACEGTTARIVFAA